MNLHQTLGMLSLFATFGLIFANKLPGAVWQWALVATLTFVAFAATYGNHNRNH